MCAFNENCVVATAAIVVGKAATAVLMELEGHIFNSLKNINLIIVILSY